MKDLTNSNIDRQNILNNNIALKRIYEYVGFEGIFYNEEYRYSKTMVANFFGVEERTINRYLENFEAETLEQETEEFEEMEGEE